MPSINFFEEQVKFKLQHPRKTSHWIRAALKKEKKKLVELNIIFCSDEYLREINTQYLNHSTYTDIVTFDTGDGFGGIEGDIYISIDRVRENAVKYLSEFDDELHRVIIHGVLHLSGYSDKSNREKAAMRKREDAYLSLRN
ncbi:MAG: rRNA maturation RNase YbeY [Cyclobacteriaceae bacterium]|jgi:rRNA maturation RNase YbeY|nr:rRNA maturation RNase YbeY [Cyclobacteriaceae bacterium]MDH4297833.1 rRNA maturation RNase YbeY [Cyclobacteriaceae bacterium]MDH5250116.1 rRNA maturation RNase YbeY [Cyclobacteriaceae bacterium]